VHDALQGLLRQFRSSLQHRRACESFTPVGYQVTRQTGSHLRLTTTERGQHHVTIPNHDPIKSELCPESSPILLTHFQISRDELMQRLFG
jgi:predicted RNA binding protein YcfA (HicA-like mRNA interferase family)